MWQKRKYLFFNIHKVHREFFEKAFFHEICRKSLLQNFLSILEFSIDFRKRVRNLSNSDFYEFCTIHVPELLRTSEYFGKCWYNVDERSLSVLFNRMALSCPTMNQTDSEKKGRISYRMATFIPLAPSLTFL